jgi:hypothetical protein
MAAACPVVILPAFVLKGNPVYCILPVEGVAYSDSFLSFCRTARFSSIQQAARSVKDPDLEFEIALLSEATPVISPATQATYRVTHGIRIEQAGGYNHVLSRGIERRELFLNDSFRECPAVSGAVRQMEKRLDQDKEIQRKYKKVIQILNL